MYDVKGKLHKILDTLPQGVRLVAISKYHPNEYIEAAYAASVSLVRVMNRNCARSMSHFQKISSGIS